MENTSPRVDKPSASIDATAEGLRWKVVYDGETVASGTAQTMAEAQAAADGIVSRISKEPIEGP
jgi:hypothetical protein